MKPPRYALYGSILMVRGSCPDCQRDALIVKGHWACCDRMLDQPPRGTQRMSNPESRRRRIPALVKQRILREQDNRCLYCSLQFGSHVTRGLRHIRLKINWDHMVPWSYAQSGRPKNIAAACQVCNGIKSDVIFDTLAEARIYVAVQKQAKRYEEGGLSALREDIRGAARLGKILL